MMHSRNIPALSGRGTFDPLFIDFKRRRRRVVAFNGGAETVLEIQAADLTVADNVHSRFGLLPNYLGDGFIQAAGVSGFVIRTSRFDLLQEGDQRWRPDQASHVSG